MTEINKLGRRYMMQSVGLIAFVSAVVTGIGYFAGVDGLLLPLAVSVAFSFVIECSDALIWCRVATKSPDSLPSFYMAVSGFRMLLALLTMFVYWLVEGREAMLTFFLVFIAYYIILLVHHSVFFARVSGSYDKLKNVK